MGKAFNRMSQSAAPRGAVAGKESRTSKALTLGWALQTGLDLAERLTPRIEHSVQVTIIGKPHANLDRLYRFAICVCSGLVSNIPGNTSQIFDAKIDHMRKVVVVNIGFTISGIKALGQIFSQYTIAALPITFQGKGVVASGNYPPFMKFDGIPLPKGTDTKEVVAGTTVLTTAPGENPGLSFNRGTLDRNNTVANSALPNDPTTGPVLPAINKTAGNTTVAIESLKNIFGFERLDKIFGFSR